MGGGEQENREGRGDGGERGAVEFKYYTCTVYPQSIPLCNQRVVKVVKGTTLIRVWKAKDVIKPQTINNNDIIQ